MKKTPGLIFILLLFITAASAQYNTNENKIWVFGQGAGLDFNSGSPVAIATNISCLEAAASLCNSSGNLLFYTDGKVVYNRIGVVMPTGGSIVPYNTSSSRQGAHIAPVIGSSGKYYVFSIQNYEDPDPVRCKLSYSIVDMALDGGMGDVVATAKGLPLDDSMSESIISIRGDSNDIWLLSHSRTSDFVSYRLTSGGIGPAIESHMDTVVHHGGGFLRVSPDGRKIVEANSYFRSGSVGYWGNCLFDFDPATGMVSNPIVFDTTGITLNAEFSPNGTKLYTLVSGQGIFQYDLSPTTPSAIYASKYVVVPNISAFGHVKLAPNDKIYFANYLNNCMSCISAPNNAGPACGYILNCVDLLSGTTPTLGLPNVYVSLSATTTESAVIALKDIAVSPNPTTSHLQISAPGKISRVSVSNLLGQVMIDNEYDSNSIVLDVADFPKGIYCLIINECVSRTFVKD